MALTWNQFGNLGLTTAQKNKLAQFAAIGQATRDRGGPPDISGVTWAQAKAVSAFIRDVNTLVAPAFEGAQHVRQRLRDEAAQSADDAVTPGTL